jgi:hypothetical protein
MDKDGEKIIAPLSFLGSLYGRWNKPDKAEPCDERLIPGMERKFGEDRVFLGPPLKSKQEALRQLGRLDEAAKVEQRLKSLGAADRSAGAMVEPHP